MSEAVRKFRIPAEQWDEQGVLLYNLNAVIAVGYLVNSYDRALSEYDKYKKIQDKNHLSDFDKLLEHLK